MIAGHVLNLHALLPVVFRLPDQPDFAIDFVVDTGFIGYLTLPEPAIVAMELGFSHRIPADLADASTIELDVYVATIVWHGVEREVQVLALGRRPLLGTRLLEESELCIQFTEGGHVTLEAV